MNHAYRLVWHQSSDSHVAVPECASGHGRGGRVRRLCAALAMGATLGGTAALAQGVLPARQLPSGAQVQSGLAQFSQTGQQLNVTQTTDKLVLDWSRFQIGKDAAVNFVQPSTSSVVLNRVSGGEISQIDGRLSANGQVFLLNPAGVVFGAGAQVNVGTLVASSLRLSNEDFLAGQYRFQGDASSGAVINQGTLTATEGGLYLIAPSVANTGTLRADTGAVGMAAGERVSLSYAGKDLIRLNVDQGTLHALVDNKGLIQADGGSVVLTAQGTQELLSAVVNNEGTVRAQTLQQKNGRILLLADMQQGLVKQSGLLDASAPNGGDGGFVETSAAKVQVAPQAVVSTLAAQGQAGHWLIDPTDYVIASSGGDITGATLSSNLQNGNITILNSSGSTGTAGNINVNDAVSWSSTNTLTLTADNNVSLTGSISATLGSVVVNATAGGFTGAGNITLGSGASLTVNQGGSSTYSGVFSGAGALLKSGNGTLTLSGDNSYTGATTISAGRLTLAPTVSGITTGTSAFAVASGATLELKVASGIQSNGSDSAVTYSGSGTIEKTGAGLADLSGAAGGTFQMNSDALFKVSAGTMRLGYGYAGDWTNNQANLDIAGGSEFRMWNARAVRFGALTGNGVFAMGWSNPGASPSTLTLGVNNQSATFSGILLDDSYPLTLTKVGSGTQTFTGRLSFASGINLNAGKIQIGDGSTSPLHTITTYEHTNTASSFQAGGDFKNRGMSVTVASGAELVFNRGDTALVDNVSIGGTGVLRNIGSGTVTLTGNLSLTGPTYVDAGILQISSTLTGSIGIASGATLQMNNASNQGLSGIISGAGALVKTGSGTLTLSGNNSYTGTVDLQAGWLSLNHVNALGQTTDIRFSGGGLAFTANNNLDPSARFAVLAGQNYRFNTNSQSVTLAADLGTLGSASLTNSELGTLTLTGNNSFASGVTLSKGTLVLGSANALGSSGSITFGTTTVGTLKYSSANAQDYSARLSATAAQSYSIDTNGQSVTWASALTSVGATLSKSGSGTLTLAGANSYSGQTSVLAGSLQAGRSSANDLSSGPFGSGRVVVSNGATLDFNGNNIGNALTLSGTGVGALGALLNSASTSAMGSGAITLAAASTLAVTGSGDFTLSGAISGAFALSVNSTGTGLLALTSANTYSGGTTLSNGNLGLYNNAALGTGALTIGNATLKLGRGVSQIDNAITLNGAASITIDNQVEYLLVGGGGAGGYGGGGAGGLLAGSMALTATGYSITVGAGGTSLGSNGANTSAFGLTASGGGGGGQGGSAGQAGGSGGGSGFDALNVSIAAGIPGQGNSGGKSNRNSFGAGGGGGGAGGAGGDATVAADGYGAGGVGGAGVASAITGTTQYYAGGGGGGANTPIGLTPGGAGGSGVGGAGAVGDRGNGGNAVANTGSGGGGAEPQGAMAGTGADGIVVARYRGAQAGTGGDTVSVGSGAAAGYTVHTFTTSGTLALTPVAARLNGVISGTGSLTADASGGSLTFNANNSYTGATRLLGGTIKTTTPTALGNGAIVTLSNAAGLLLSLQNSDLNLGGLAGGGGNGGDIDLVSQMLTVGSANSNGSFAGRIYGAGRLVKQGSGLLELSGASDYTGGTLISGGRVLLGSSSGGAYGPLGSAQDGPLSATWPSEVTVASGATLDLNGQTLSNKLKVQGTGLNGLGAIVNTSATAATLSGAVTLTGDATLSATGSGGLVLSSTFTGAHVLTIKSNANLNLGAPFDASALSGLVLGDVGSTSDVAINTPLSVAGPVSVYGANIQVNAPVASTSAGNLLFQTSGTLGMASGSSISASNGNITLVAARLNNLAGASALSVASGQHWQVWSRNADPFNTSTGDKLGGLVYDYKQYNAVYGQTAAAGIGSGVHYSLAPVLTASLSGTFTKTYDGHASMAIPTDLQTTATGALDQDVVLINAPTNATIVSAGTGPTLKDAGTGKAIQTTGMSIASISNNGRPVYGYQTVTVSGTTGSITPQTVTLSASKSYDGTTVLGAGAVQVLTGVGNETLSYSNASSNDAHVSTSGKYIVQLTLNDAIDQSGGLAINYQLPALNASNAPVRITPAQLTASASISAVNKTYDGLLAASGSTLSGSTIGTLNGDNVALDTSAIALAFDNAHAGTRSISASGNVALSTLTPGGVGLKDGTAGNAVGAQAGDYALAAQPSIASVSATITPAQLTASASISAVNKTYDGLLAASGSTLSGSTIGTLNGDSVALDTSAIALAFDNAHAGTRSISASGTASLGTLTPGGVGLKDGTAGNAVGAQAGDYALAAQPSIASVGATITPAQLTASATISGTNKTYDGLLAANGSSVSGSTSGTLNGDNVALDTSAIALVFDNAHAGTRSISASGNVALGTLTPGGVGLKDGTAGNAVGAQAGDYTLAAQPSIASVGATITPALISQITGLTANDKEFDGNTQATLDTSLVSLAGVLGSDQVQLASGWTAHFADSAAGINKVVTVTGLALAGADASNYQLATYTLTTTASILNSPQPAIAAVTATVSSLVAATTSSAVAAVSSAIQVSAPALPSALAAPVATAPVSSPAAATSATVAPTTTNTPVAAADTPSSSTTSPPTTSASSQSSGGSTGATSSSASTPSGTSSGSSAAPTPAPATAAATGTAAPASASPSGDKTASAGSSNGSKSANKSDTPRATPKDSSTGKSTTAKAGGKPSANGDRIGKNTLAALAASRYATAAAARAGAGASRQALDQMQASALAARLRQQGCANGAGSACVRATDREDRLAAQIQLSGGTAFIDKVAMKNPLLLDSTVLTKDADVDPRGAPHTEMTQSFDTIPTARATPAKKARSSKSLALQEEAMEMVNFLNLITLKLIP